MAPPVAAVAHPTGDKPKGLKMKLAAVMRAVARVPKRGRNTAQNYDYVTEADVAEMIREALADLDVITSASFDEPAFREIEIKDGRKLTVCRIKGTFTFEDAESDQKRESTFWGEGMDTGDKAIYKAMTGAEKYWLLKTFLISSGDDPENDAPARPRQTPPRPATTAIADAAAVLGGEVEETQEVLDSAPNSVLARKIYMPGPKTGPNRGKFVGDRSIPKKDLEYWQRRLSASEDPKDADKARALSDALRAGLYAEP